MALHQHRRGWLVGLAGASLIASGFGTTVAIASPPADLAPLALQTEKAPAQIDAQVQQELDAKGSTEFWVHFAARPDLSQFESISDWDARGEAVYEALHQTAEKSQADVRAQLDEQGVDYQHFYISNVIKVEAGDADLVSSLASSEGVDRIIASFEVEAPDDRVDEANMAPTAVEWGVTDINADDVWADFGVTGEGIVVANIDTGVQYDHPALVSHYRGNNGDGTFDHNYNWLEVQGDSDFPTDYDGHGSHTMGTMIGDDGGENQIGVAPGATWIATSGCCPSDAALMESMEWVLAPTDLNGENPDTAKRPHIVNNSWGTTAPSNDPFGEEAQEAWNASGIFGVFANGNSGSACASSGSPGSRTINYSVGNYNSGHTIAGSSSRGPGQDGEMKPNISAPGSNVRSSVPGNGYAAFTGTSMAAPHVAGAVALLWSGAPSLVGDIEGTRALLDGTAIDTEDLQCGGTAADNNVFGEGRLDVLLAMQDAPTGDTGTLTGTITDTATGDPISGAAVTITGPLERNLVTNDAGQYTALVTAGDYDVAASAFGYLGDSATVTVTAAETTTQNFALEPAESGTVSGVVTDASGHDWPLYASISVNGTPLQTFSDPETGAYSFEAPVGTTYTVSATAQYPGYIVGTQEVTVTPTPSTTATVNFGLTVDVESCTAPGYEHVTTGVSETFDGTEAPAGWTVTDEIESGSVWVFNDPGSRGNLTGGEGGFAIVDSDEAGSSAAQDTSLVSPSADLSTLTDPAIGFKHDFNAFLGAESGDVDVSIDGGTTWTTLASYNVDTNGEVFLQMPEAAGESDVQVRFHYTGSWDYWWEVDDVFIGNRACSPIEGGLVVGNVYDLNTGDGIVGASVTNVADDTQKAVSAATEADDNLDDGFYWLFSDTPGANVFEAVARNYESKTEDVTVAADDVVRADFELGAGYLTVTPEAIDTEVDLGDSATEDLTIANDGTGAVEVVLQEVPGAFELLRADGTRMTLDDITAAAGAPEIKRDVPTSFAAAPAKGAMAEFEAEATPSDEPWVDLAPVASTVMDNRVVSLDGTWYNIGGTDGFESRVSVEKYDNEAMAWAAVADLPIPGQAVSVGALNGQLVVSGGWSDGDPVVNTYTYDPGADAWTQVADAPFAVAGAGQAVADGKLFVVGGCTTADCTPMGNSVAAYDAASDTWAELADYPINAAFVSCGGIGDAVYCSGGNDGSAASTDTYVYDSGADTWTELAPAPVDAWASNYAVANGQLIVNGGVQGGVVSNATFAYDPAADAWSTLPNSNTAVYRGGAACGFVKVGGSTGGFTPIANAEQLPGYDECGTAGGDVEWLELSQTEFTVPAGEEVTVQVTTDGDVPQPGVYSASIRVTSNAPGAAVEVPVTMTVSPPLFWGKLQGLVEGETCEGVASPLAAAGVDISPTDGDHPGWFLTTTAEGTYATWIDTRVGESDVTATKDGYRPESATVTVPRRETITQDFALRDATCEEVPGPVHPDVIRLSGSNRYGTAAAISGLFDEADTVFVATGADYPDALAAAALAGSTASPVLLTSKDAVPPATLNELGRLSPANVVVLGGGNSVSDDVLEAIEHHVPDADVERLSGSNRYGTAAAIAQEFESADVVYVATGQNYPDALAGAARAGAPDGPVLLVKPDRVPGATASELARLNPADIKVLGGTGAVSDDVLTALGEYGEVERISGTTRFETAVKISQDYETNANVFVASGRNWPDALAGAARAGMVEAPVLLTEPTEIPDSTWEELERLKPGTVYVLGGTAAISSGVADQLATLE